MRRLTLVSGLVVLSAVALAPKAQAQNANVDFSGTIAKTCTINSFTNGTLALKDARTILADSTTGTPGKLNVSCNAGTTFTVTSVANNGSTLSSGTFATAVDGAFTTVRDGATTVAQGQVSPTGNAAITAAPGTPGAVQAGPINAKDYSVDLSVFKVGTTSVLPPGTYNVRVNVALAPQ